VRKFPPVRLEPPGSSAACDPLEDGRVRGDHWDAEQIRADGWPRLKQLEAKLAAGQRWRDSGLVFSTPVGTPLDGRNVTRAFRIVLDSQGLPIIRIHDLRHCCATLLLMQGVSPRVVNGDSRTFAGIVDPQHLSHVLPAGRRMPPPRWTRFFRVLEG